MFGKLTRQAGALTFSRSLGQVLNVVAGMLIVRALTQENFGTYRQVILLYSTLQLLGDAAFSQSLFYFIPRQRERAGAFMGQALLVAVAMSAVWVAGLTGLGTQVGRYFSNPDLTGHMLLLGAYLGATLLSKVPEAGLITLERTSTVAWNTAIFESLRLVLVLAALQWNAAITWILAALATASFARVTHLLWCVRDELRFTWSNDLRVQFRYSMALWLPGLFNNTAVYAHQYIVGHYFDPAQYAIYAVACFQVPFLGVLASSLNEVFLVRATQYASESNCAELRALWTNACRKSLMVFVPVTVGLILLSRPLIVFINTERYSASVPLFAILLLVLPFHGMFQDGIFRAFGRMQAYSAFYVFRGVLAVGLGIAGVKWFGLWGAAASSVLAVAVLNTAQLAKVASLVQVSWSGLLPWKDIGKILLACIPAAIVVLPVLWIVHWPPAQLAAGVALFAGAYLLACVKLGLVPPDTVASLATSLWAKVQAAVPSR